MRAGVSLLRTCPEPWVGIAPPYDKDWTEKVFKPMVQTRAWDPLSKTWWFMRSYEPAVTQALREKNWIPEAALEAQRRELYRDKATPTPAPDMGGGAMFGWPGAGQTNSQDSLAQDYAALSLHPSAPAQLVDWAIAFWRHQYAAIGAPPTRLMQAEEAYQRIVGAGHPSVGRGPGWGL